MNTRSFGLMTGVTFLLAGTPAFAQTTPADTPAAGMAEIVPPEATLPTADASTDSANRESLFDRTKLEADLRKTRDELLQCQAAVGKSIGAAAVTMTKKVIPGSPPPYRPAAPKPATLRINPESIPENGKEVRGPNGRAYFVRPLPKPPATDAPLPIPIAYVDAPQEAIAGHPFAVIVRVEYTAAEKVQAGRAGLKRVLLVQNVPTYGTALLSAADAALFGAASQDFYVSPGLPAERVWHVTPQRAGEMPLKIALSPYQQDASAAAVQLPAADLMVQVKPDETMKQDEDERPATPAAMSWGTGILLLVVGLMIGWLMRGRTEDRESRGNRRTAGS